MELRHSSHQTFGYIESALQEVRRLQEAQLKKGVHACIPGTQHTYKEVIQLLVGLDLRRQCEECRQRKHQLMGEARCSTYNDRWPNDQRKEER
jgi:hypothetical protein